MSMGVKILGKLLKWYARPLHVLNVSSASDWFIYIYIYIMIFGKYDVLEESVVPLFITN